LGSKIVVTASTSDEAGSSSQRTRQRLDLLVVLGKRLRIFAAMPDDLYSGT
jgi:hypothetical protein